MKVLIVSQVIPQWYVDVITNALPKNCEIDIITGSQVSGNVIASPEHDAESFKSRLVCWWKHLRFVSRWIKQNKNKKYDLIFAVSNPPINSYIGLKLKKTFSAPFIYMNWDLYPQCIDYMIKNPVVHLMCKCWHIWNSKNYPKIDRMLTIGDVVAQSINAELKKKIDISVIPIGVNTNQIKPVLRQENIFCEQNGLMDKFIVLYSGKMGYGHNIELIIEAAKKLKDNKDIVFVFIGNGQKYELVKNAAEENENIMVFPLQPAEIFPYSMACGDVGVVTEEEKMAHLFMPSKTYSMMACGMPVLGVCTDCDDLYNVISENKIGYAVTDGSADTFAQYVKKLYDEREQLEALKARARECAVEKYEITEIEKQYKTVFEKYLHYGDK
ncbi:MAG: glycosyltransferase family 4 protein [Clostridia bacterium]|nr:glycosyltransferase family 4 protein [Clostridia bacterium]